MRIFSLETFRKLLFLIPVISAVYLFSLNINTWDLQFTFQAKNFLEGRLDISDFYPERVIHDTVFINEKYYWPQGPFPSILLMPFLFIPQFSQVHLQIILVLITAAILFKLAGRKGFDRSSSFYLTAAFLFASPVLGIIVDPNSWFFAQIVCLFLSILLIYETETHGNPLILGLLGGAILATRPTAAIIALVVFYIVLKKTKLNKLFFSAVYFLPILITVIILVFFNQARFDNVFDNGYYTNYLGTELAPVREMGVFSLVHIPTNFYYYFLISVEPITSGNFNLVYPYFTFSRWGLSLFIVAPFFLIYSLKSLFKKEHNLPILWTGVFMILFILLCYFAPGMRQFGPRYTIDFFPLLYLIILLVLQKPNLTEGQKWIIIFSSIFNSYLLLSPHLKS